MYLWIRKKRLNFGSRLHLDRDPGLFEGFFSIASRSIFLQFVSCLWKSSVDLRENFIIDVFVEKEVNVTFWIGLEFNDCVGLTRVMDS